MSALVGTTVQVDDGTAVEPVGDPFTVRGRHLHAVRIGEIGCDVRIVGTADDLDRLAAACAAAAATIRGTA